MGGAQAPSPSTPPPPPFDPPLRMNYNYEN